MSASLAIHTVGNNDETVNKLTVLVSFLKDQYRNQQHQLALIDAKLTLLDIKLSTAESKLTDVLARLDNVEQVIAPRLGRETLSSPNAREVDHSMFNSLSPLQQID